MDISGYFLHIWADFLDIWEMFPMDIWVRKIVDILAYP